MAATAANSTSVNAVPMDVRTALKEGMARLRAANVPSSTLAAELLLLHVLGRDRAWMYAHPEAPVDPAAAEKYVALLARRAAGEPTQYLTGKQEFWGLEFEVTPAVLIPRPETEHVVEVALERLGEERGIRINMRTGESSPTLRIADVGTGSGCIAVALARELPHAEIIATDISSDALEVARRNAARHEVAERIRFVRTDLLRALLDERGTSGHDSELFDLIVSNPPYVARNEAAELAVEVRDHEPASALFGGPTGTELFARLIEQAAELLAAPGDLVVELGYNCADTVRAIVSRQRAWANVSVTNDLAGIPRVLAAERIADAEPITARSRRPG
ncbi:MAG TPA: peptide chain release factor N(5)-glutamine methyltransferase [Candidatus Dormibacteraeota bacterium]|nr:peptide chain release factor N(5)-glutamine methyltransferase [Candidatus Dormibacteraeota bacterium]